MSVVMSENAFGELVDENTEGMEQWSGAVAVVTGASAGIGAAVARKLVKFGVIVVGIARRVERLEELAQELKGQTGAFHPRQCDLANEDQITETFQWIDESLGPISILINNAGVLMPTNLNGGSTEMWKTTFDVNVLAICICTKLAIKSMTTNGINGHIVHVASVGRDCESMVAMPEPIMNVYPATKLAVVALIESLRKEINRSQLKIKISAVSPGLTATEVYRDFDDSIKEEIENSPKLQPEDVANAIIFTLATPPGVQVQDILIRAVGANV